MKRIALIAGLLAMVTACNLDKFPSDSISAESMADPVNSSVVTDGTYAMFKSILNYEGMVYSANSYVRHYFQMAEFRGDNITLCAHTTDPLNEAIIYRDVSTLGNTGYYWWIAYKILFSCNSMIGAIKEGDSVVNDHILGENYFMRGVVHMHLLQLYSMPVSNGKDKLGIILRTSTDCSETHRATVGECLTQIEEDLKKAAELMKGGTRRGNNGYAGYEAAMGMLSRAYLYDEKWDECIATVNELLGSSDGSDKLDPDYQHLFEFSKDSKEVLWNIVMIPSDWTDQKGSMGSMFYSYDALNGGSSGPGGGGWGEIYYSQPLLDLFGRYPQDKRFLTMAEAFDEDPVKKMAYWPEVNPDSNFGMMVVDNAPTVNAAGEVTACKDSDGNSYTVTKKVVNTYPEYYITKGGKEIRIGVRNKCATNSTYPVVYMKKFARMEGGDNVLNCPIMIRWAEVILNRAEAYAHKGDESGVLKDIKVIRDRAGLGGEAAMTAANRAERGYSDLVDLVLDERRLELCFEGFRALDLFRNKKPVDRRYGGAHPWEVINYNDKRIPYQIPYGEVSVSGIPQNER